LSVGKYSNACLYRSEAVPHVLLTGFLPGDKGPYVLTPNTVELIPTLGALFPRGGPVQDPVLTLGFSTDCSTGCVPVLRRLRVVVGEREVMYRGTSLIRKRLHIGPYSRPVHRAL